MIPRETIDTIIQTSHIEDVVGDFVILKKRGENYMGLCPFHSEKTPSFTVSPNKGIYKCFGCGKGGNVVNFVMEHEKLDYEGAIKYLAKRYNINIAEKEKSTSYEVAIEKSREIIEGSVQDYYNSISESFYYRLRNAWKINLSGAIFFFSLFYLLLNIVPVLPIAVEGYLTPVMQLAEKYLQITLQENNFLTKWLIGFLLSLLICLLCFPVFIFWDRKEKRKAVQIRLMNFCYAFAIREELKKYIINGRNEHIEKSIQYIRKLIPRITTVQTDGETDSPILNISTLSIYSKKLDWVKLSTNTLEILEAFESVDNKIRERLTQKFEIDSTLPSLEYLILYEYSKIKPDELNNSKIKMGDRKDMYLDSFAREVNNLNGISSVKEHGKEYKLKKILNNFIDLFTSTNALVVFIMWFFLFSVLFGSIAISLIHFLTLKFDSTILVGILTVPFVGAITITATLFGSRKKG